MVYVGFGVVDLYLGVIVVVDIINIGDNFNEGDGVVERGGGYIIEDFIVGKSIFLWVVG